MARQDAANLNLLELFPVRRILFSRRSLFVVYLGLMPPQDLCSEPRLRLGSFPVMEHRTKIGNRLLAALPSADFDLLVPHLRKVSLERDLVLVRSGDPVEQIHFPCTALIAFVMDMPNGQAVATTMVGNEGAAGILSTVRPVRSPMTAVVRIAGTTWQISPARFQAALVRSHALADTVQLHMRSLLIQFQHIAACNALHSVETRLARWLLQIHDQIGQDTLPLTQETLSELLGVRRTTVTHAVHKLRASGAIRSNRRSSIEVDRPRLEAAACECYEIMRDRIDRIIPAEGTKPSGRGAAAHGLQRSHAQPWTNGDKVHAHPRAVGTSRSRSH
ncbi:CRP-like cAMP-binding protein [Bradyrhizobium sp. i1.8.4]|uniref:Crp/Fnr family transcriptional regulator n=1 Tax=unclassified Bradyrhizobium TaxID=2631580 RepID=UPI003D24FF50